MPGLSRLVVPVLVVVFCAGLSLASEKQTHLFMLSGQSNMKGLNPEISFAPAIEKTFGKENVIVVKSAQNGQPIRRWYKEWKPGKTAAPGKPWTSDLYDTLIAAAQKGLGDRKPDTITFVWMQGETDAREGYGDVYAQSLIGLVNQIKKDMKCEKFYFVIGRLSDYKKGGDWEVVRQAQVKAAEGDPCGAWVDTDDLNGSNNALHYIPEGYKTLGERFAQEAIKLITGTRK
jgi:hypothetical protein